MQLKAGEGYPGELHSVSACWHRLREVA